MNKNILLTIFATLLTVGLIGGGIYFYNEFQKHETEFHKLEEKLIELEKKTTGKTTVDTHYEDMDNLMNDIHSGDAPMMDHDDMVIDDEIEQKKITGTIEGKLCYPSSFLPAGEVVVKNTSTKATIEYKVDGKSSNYSVSIAPGKYILRYQAHADAKDTKKYLSGYYSICSKNGSTAEFCDTDAEHQPIVVEVKVDETQKAIDLCDFYYQKEPTF